MSRALADDIAGINQELLSRGLFYNSVNRLRKRVANDWERLRDGLRASAVLNKQ